MSRQFIYERLDDETIDSLSQIELLQTTGTLTSKEIANTRRIDFIQS